LKGKGGERESKVSFHLIHPSTAATESVDQASLADLKGTLAFLRSSLISIVADRFLREREIVICEKESVFLFLFGGKHFPLIKGCFFVD
jgi:hypothetical protein